MADEAIRTPLIKPKTRIHWHTMPETETVMKTILINASPRKNWNTAKLLDSARQGAELMGAETEEIHLYDLHYTGCRSCLACKRQGAERCRCYWKDDLTPVIDRIMNAHALIIGTPIYMGEPTAAFRALYERLGFCALSYDGQLSYFPGKLNVGLIYTMNAPIEYYEGAMRSALQPTESFLGALFHGMVKTYAACNTLQVEDYSKYSMSMFNAEMKHAIDAASMPSHHNACYELGVEVSQP